MRSVTYKTKLQAVRNKVKIGQKLKNRTFAKTIIFKNMSIRIEINSNL